MSAHNSGRVLFIGTLPLVDDITEYQKLGYNDIAACVSQKNIVKALELVLGQSIDIISAVNFPTESVQYVVRHDVSTDTSFRVSVGYRNLKYLGLVNEEFALRAAVREWFKAVQPDEKVTVFAYSLASRFLGAAEEVRKLAPDCTIKVIAPDMPQYMAFGKQSLLRRILKKIDYRLIIKRLKCADYYFLYTKYMAEPLGIDSSNNWRVFEGIPDLTAYEGIIFEPDNEERFVITYAGGLTLEANLDAFIEALKQIGQTNVQFVVMGCGPEESKIKKLANDNCFVEFRGMCPHAEVLRQLLSSTLLVIPRATGYEYTKYSCPSKLLEYMASGVPVVTTHLAGIPDDYLPHVFLFRDDSVHGMKSTMVEILSMPKKMLEERGASARRFLEEEKNLRKAGCVLLGMDMEDK